MRLFSKILMICMALLSFAWAAPTVGAAKSVALEKQPQTASVNRGNTAASVIKDKDIEKKESVKIEEIPIYLQGSFSKSVDTKFNAIRTETDLFFPLESIRSASHYNIFTSVKGTTFVLVPHIELRGSLLYVDDSTKGSLITLPVETIHNTVMVNSRNVSIGMGIQWELRDGRVTFSTIKGAIPERKRVALQTPLYWAFDPGPTVGEPYTNAMVNGGTNVISPTMFELDLFGLKTKNEPNNAYVEKYNKENFEVWPLITNQFNPELTSDILKNESNWHVYADALAGNALIYGYGGYNFDFENVNLNDKEKLVRFVAYLTKQLKPLGLYTSMDVTGYSDSPNWSLVYDRKALSEHLDYIVLMAYDEVWAKSKSAGPVASYPWVEKNVIQLMTEVPSEKIVLGIPFYTRLWEESNMSKHAVSKTLPVKDLPGYKSKYADSIQWNDTLKLNYLQYKEGANTYKIWMEDESSLAYKMRLIHDKKLAGFAAWRKGFETPLIWKSISEVNGELQLTKKKQ